MKNTKLIGYFLLYLGILFGFSCTYDHLYRQDRDHFVFDQKKYKSKEYYERLNRQKRNKSENQKKLQKAIAFVDSTAVLFSNGKSPIDNSFKFDKKGNPTFKLKFDNGREGNIEIEMINPVKPNKSVNLNSIKGKVYINFRKNNSTVYTGNTSSNVRPFQKMREYINFEDSNPIPVEKSLDKNRKTIELIFKRVSQKLKEKLTNTNYRNNFVQIKLNPADFLYFTFLSIKGDIDGEIQPNSVKARSLVRLQSFVPWILLIFMINSMFKGLNLRLRKNKSFDD